MNNKEIEKTNREVAKSAQYEIRGNKEKIEDSSKIYEELKQQFLSNFNRPLVIDDLVDTLEFV